MANVNFEGASRPMADAAGRANESPVSAISWAAVLAGTVVMVSLTFILLALGSGLGLAAVSPWPGHGVSATTFTVVTAISLIVIQWIASAVGGYTTGRLRTKWVGVHTHEVFFRDTAHGLVTWSAAAIIGMLLLAHSVARTAGTAVHGAATVSQELEHVAAGPNDGNAASYDLDSLFRSPSAEPVSADRQREVGRLLSNALAAGGISADDKTYLTNLVAARSGVTPEQAQQRVDDVMLRLKEADTKARQAADAARKGAAETSIYMALSMFLGAFIACAAAALGGKLRDEHL
jgi:hypothetical protein